MSDEAEINRQREQLWHRIYRTLVVLAVIMLCMGLTGVGIILSLSSVGDNQKAGIANQKEIAVTTNRLIDESVVLTRSVSAELASNTQLLASQERELKSVSERVTKNSELFIKQEKEIEANKIAISEIVIAERELVSEQKQVLVAARQASFAAYEAAVQTRNTNATLKSKVATTSEKISVEKQKIKLDKQAKTVAAKSQKLNVLVGQYKTAIKKVKP